MSLAQVRADFQSLLNRDDCTTDDADKFLRLGLGRVQRDLRAPPLERVHYVDVVADTNVFTLPADYIEAIDLFVDGKPLNRASYRLLTRLDAIGTPTTYARYRNTLYIRGAVSAGSRIELLYYGEATTLTGDDDDNEITTSCPDLWMYAALTYASGFYALDNKADHEASYRFILEQLNAQTQADEWGGLQAIQPLYIDPGM